ncbi:MAG: methyltransferase domain-containing protein [Nanoarchaeota archaeon]|nr:methyltransferase domain-containing protein [Nanoarchaeota archaeon]
MKMSEKTNKNQLVKLDIGCGKNKKEGYVGIDIDPETGADIIASALNLPFEDESVDEISSSHLVEHFSLKEAENFFSEIYRVLRFGGKVEIKIDKDWTKRKLLAKDLTHKYRFKAKEIEKMVEKFSSKKVKDKIYFFRFNAPRRKIFVELKK